MKYLYMAAMASVCLAACDSGNTSPAATEPAPAANPVPSAGPVIKDGYYSFDGLPEERIRYQEIDGMALFQGDIVLRNPGGKKSATALVSTKTDRWTNNGTIAYDMQSMPSDLRENWFSAMRHIALNTNLRFSRSKGLYVTQVWRGTINDYIKVVPNTSFAGGYSAVGRVGGAQELGLSSGVGAGLIVHELLHAIGHWHEQSRADRNQYVQVNTQNIQSGYAHNFDIHSSDGQMLGTYDYCSLMHYFSTAFSVNGQATLSPLYPVSCSIRDTDNIERSISSIGQQSGLSQGDIEAVASKYPNVSVGRPFAFAGFDQRIYSSTNGTSSVAVTLDASRSFPVQGSGLTYSWKAFANGPCPRGSTSCSIPIPISNNTSAIATVVQPLPLIPWSPRQPVPEYRRASEQQYILTVTDSAGRSMSDVVSVSIRGN